jgi:hypothetical protein
MTAAVLVLALNSCDKKTETFETVPLSDYFPLKVGKYITYRLDSTVFTNFGLTEEVHRYQVKDVVDAPVVDNLGRPSFRIIRYLRDSLGTGAWAPNATFLATALTEQGEWVDNNMRYIKMHLPIREGFSWKGNSHIDTYSVGSEVKYLADWDYLLEKVGEPVTIRGRAIPNTVTVNQRDERIPDQPFNPAGYYERNYAKEIYGKGIGLVFKEFIHWEYQPPRPPGTQGDKKGYGVKLEMIDHN